QDGVEFRFVQGTQEVPPPRSHPEFFSPPPHYSFTTDFSVEELERNGLCQTSEQMGDTPKDTIRNLFPPNCMTAARKDGYQQDMDWLNQLLDSEEPFDAVLGFSHGACVAATFLEDNTRK
ncbi:MAG: hypothetical protein LQ343_008062, partial [Gyalolechia ehrenbergii]